MPMPPNRFDRCTVSNFDETLLKEAKLEFEVDFNRKVLHGLAKLTFVVIREHPDFIVLDVESQEILSVRDGDTGDKLLFTSQPGSLKVEVTPFCDLGTLIRLNIKFRTDPSASGLFWIEPRLSDDGINPFLFSHSLKAQCRSIFPCQESLAVKFKYTAEVIVPNNFTVIMSAAQKGVEVTKTGKKKYKFKQTKLSSCCWFALVVGALDSCKVGPRSTLWGLSSHLETGAYKLAELENTVILGEQLCGDYQWDTADVVLMPSLYPFTAVAYPNCLYMPSVVMDRDIEYDLAKAVAQSWMGALFSGYNWDHLWLNEGFATFVARKIIARIHGESMFHLYTNIGLDDLKTEVRQLMMSGPEGKSLTKLVSDVQTGRPHPGLGTLLSEKGHAFLTYLEQFVGGPAQFEPFIRAYVNKYKFKSLDSSEFGVFFTKHFASIPNVKNINWNQWLFSIGLPWNLPAVETTLITEPVLLAQSWKSWDLSNPPPFHLFDISAFCDLQVRMFLSLLYSACPTFSVLKVRSMQRFYNINHFKDPEIKLKWLLLNIQAKCPEQLPECFRFLEEEHRHTYIQPLLRKLRSWEEFKNDILQHYQQQKDKMLPITQQLYEEELRLLFDPTFHNKDKEQDRGVNTCHEYIDTVALSSPAKP